MTILDRFRIDGQVAVVTGAGRGIGAATALALAEAGADVVVSARTEEQLKETARQGEAAGPQGDIGGARPNEGDGGGGPPAAAEGAVGGPHGGVHKRRGGVPRALL